MSVVTIGSASHPGMKKTENQDYHSYYLPENGDAKKKGVLLALADGMGGPSGGATASKVAVETLMTEYYKHGSGSILEALNTAFLKANETVIEKSQEHPETEGMGSTLTAVVIINEQLYFAHVGDSRGYVILGNEISQFTEDHSFVASLVKAGAITKENARTHPERNIITRAIGLDPDLKVDVARIDKNLQKDQYILLCCDGLHGVVSEEAILNAVHDYKAPDAICEHLVEKANQNGGPDNITVLIARIDKVNLISSLTNRLMDLVR
jgi:protein phosphatase